MPSLRLGLSTTAIYFVIVALATVYSFTLTVPPLTTLEVLDRLLPLQVILVVLIVFVVTRYANWATVGFGPIKWSALLWLSPSILAMALMIRDLSFVLTPDTFDPTAAVWMLLIVAFLIGFSEEVMFRGILLRGAMTKMSLGSAMLLSAVLFALMHVISGIVMQSFWPMVQQTAFAFCVGFFLAPMALKLGNLWPIILWHGVWDLLIFASQIVGVMHPTALFAILIQAVICVWIWADLARKDML